MENKYVEFIDETNKDAVTPMRSKMASSSRASSRLRSKDSISYTDNLSNIKEADNEASNSNSKQ